MDVSWPLADELGVECRRKKKGKDDSKFKNLNNLREINVSGKNTIKINKEKNY